MAVDTSISSLKSKVVAAGGFQRNNRFTVSFTNVPNNPSLTVLTQTTSDQTSVFLAESVLLPNITVLTQADSLSGPGLGRTSPRSITYRDGVVITFPVLGDWELPKALNEWVRVMFPQATTQPFGWITPYYAGNGNTTNLNIDQCSMQIKALDLNGNISATYTFKEVFPVEIFPLQFAAPASNEILKITARFAFRTYTLT